MIRAAAVFAVLTAFTLGCSGKANPCGGGAGQPVCPSVAGLYTATFTPQVHCSLWAPHSLPVFNINVTQSGSQVTMAMQPDDALVHNFTGTIDGNGGFQASEPTPMAGLNIAYGSVSGNFSSGMSLSFTGTLILNPPFSGDSSSGGGGMSADMCSGTYTLNAQGTPAATAAVSSSSGSTSGSGSSSSTAGSSGSTGSHSSSSSGTTGTSATTSTGGTSGSTA